MAIDCIAGVREADNSIKPSLLELNTIRRLSNDERQFSIATNIIFELFLSIFVGIKDAVFMLPKISLRYYISKNIYLRVGLVINILYYQRAKLVKKNGLHKYL